VRSGLGRLKFLLPDFLCQVVPDTLTVDNVSYSYYRIRPDLTIDWDSVKKQQYDVLYIINYFGARHRSITEHIADNTIVIEDNVFLPVVEPTADYKKWIGFNSFRKISCMADGSIVRSTVKLDDSLINTELAGFQELKYRAKQLKYEYIHDGSHTEEEYLRLFQEAEGLIDRQNEIYRMSDTSLQLLLRFYRNLDREYSVRKANFSTLKNELGSYGIKFDPEYPNLFPMLVEQRDELRSYLCERNIFLPVHWPPVCGADNPLTGRILSIPVDSRYTTDDMLYAANAVKSFYR
jgi:Predicted pyridoxal phosphate-dependent enzyme apparently involved in regulation of cell wall biogenesis